MAATVPKIMDQSDMDKKISLFVKHFLPLSDFILDTY
jgi:hypothetical protein